MRSYRVSVNTDARAALLAIVEHLAAETPTAASRLIDDFNVALGRLEQLPESGSRFHRNQQPTRFRWVWIDRTRIYQLYYEIMGNAVRVLHVRAGSGKLPKSLS